MFQVEQVIEKQARPGLLASLLKLMRPKQWTKNAFVFGALFFAQRLFDLAAVASVLQTFLAFSLISSSVYVLNDLVDVEKDRLHPKKRLRPLASGAVSRKAGGILGVALLLVAMALAWNVGFPVLVIVASYFALNIAYSFGLKQVAMLDLFIIALGFVLRVLSGAYAIPVEPSPWLLLCTLLLALFLGICKRRSEFIVLQEGAAGHRKNLGEYSEKLLDQLIGIVAAVTIMAYSLYTLDSPVGSLMIYTIPFVIYAMFRYLFLVYRRDEGGEPAEILLGDRPFIASCLLWGLSAFVVSYVLPH